MSWTVWLSILDLKPGLFTSFETEQSLHMLVSRGFRWGLQ